MQIQLMRFSGDPKRVNKEAFLSNRSGKVYAIDGTLKDATSVLDPVIAIQRQSSPVQYKYNYMYIPEFKRYYYIKFDVENEKFWIIHAHCDVLYSNLSDIVQNQAIISKTENKSNANLYINDGSFVMDSRKRNQVYNFPSGFSANGHNILIVAGGVGSAV